MTLPNDPRLRETLCADYQIAIDLLAVDMYYFGLVTMYYGHVGLDGYVPRHIAQPLKTHIQVLKRLAEWKKGEPKEWRARMYKPYFNDWGPR